MEERPRRVLVVGGGAAGVIAAARLLRDSDSPIDVRIVERSEAVGPGLAYRTREPLHLLNNYAGRMSALEDDPGDLVDWCLDEGMVVTPATFLPRRVYGRYLAGLLARVDVRPGSRLTRLRGEVVGLDERPAGYEARLASGARIVADVVVLALGNPPPRDLPAYRSLGTVYAADPWAADLTDRVGRGARVLLVGTGLTAVDVAAQLADARHDVELVAVSRHAMLPRRHWATAPEPSGSFPVVDDLARLMAEVRDRGARLEQDGGDWRALVESVKAVANDLWRGLTHGDRERFVRHVARHWEVARHRMAPPIADIVEGLLLDGRLRVSTPDAVDASSFDLVVNCTGPAPVWTPGWSPLVDALTANGLVRPDRLGLGLDVTPDGRAVGKDGRPARGIHVLGAARRGVEWEVAAVPDLRRQAEVLAARLAMTAPPAPVAVAPSAQAEELVVR